jgi:hypothetical protein
MRWRIASAPERLAASSGAYLRWSDPSGAEMWLQVNANNELIGMPPLRRPVSRAGRVDRSAPCGPAERTGRPFPRRRDLRDFGAAEDGRTNGGCLAPAARRSLAHELGPCHAARNVRDSAASANVDGIEPRAEV